MDRASLLTSLGVFDFEWCEIKIQELNWETGTFYTQKAGRIFLRCTFLGFSHMISLLIAPWLDEPRLVLGVLSACSANHAFWVATPSVGCKTACVSLYPRRRQLHCFAQSFHLSHLEGLAELVSPLSPGASESQMKSPGCAIDLNQATLTRSVESGPALSGGGGGHLPLTSHSTSVGCLQNHTCCFADGRAGEKITI